ncbi:MAG: carbohydrate kinase family protein [Erysipelotrichaceae bacterium]|nr:carbohydrate kinase family protein [Erysipelotrichaceae bacterium]
MSYRYIAAGISIINDIQYADGSFKEGRLGGCAVFAYDGIAFFTDSVAFVSSGGEDFFDFYGGYFKDNGISPEGISISLPYTHRTLLKYENDGTWKERSLYGDSYFAEQSENCRSSLEKLKPFLDKETKGLYLDSAAQEKIFEEIPEIRKLSPDLKILWEPPTFSSKDPAMRQRILADLKEVDCYSMNLDEASAFFDVSGKEEIVRKIMDLGIPCFLRMAEEGSAWIEDKQIYSLPAYDPVNAKDVTGCGNCSAAAALYARSEAPSLELIPLYANLASGFCSRYEGPSPVKKARDSHAFEQMKKYYERS